MESVQDKAHRIMFCELKHVPGTVQRKNLIDSLLDIYAQFVHRTHMELLGLPEMTRNWEQIEAHDSAASLVTRVIAEPHHQVLRRTVFTVGEQDKIVKVVDLVQVP